MSQTCPYRPLRVLGEGRTARVEEAVGPTGRVALKRPRSPSDAARLQEEGRLLAMLPGIGLPDLVDRAPDGGWLALELLPGPDLWTWSRPRTVQSIVDALAALADTLARLHAAGLSHGDVKASNVLMDDHGRPRLLDLGLAVSRPAEPSGPPARGFSGTLGAAAPEQLAGSGPTPEGDVYALGALAYRTLTGAAPFPGSPAAQVLAATDTLPLPPAGLRPGLPSGLDALILRMLHRRAEARPPAESLGAALRRSLATAPLDLSPALMDHWSAASRAVVAIQDQSARRILVVCGGEASRRVALQRSLVARVAAEGLPEEPGGVMVLGSHGSDAEIAARASRAEARLVLVEHPTPLPSLASLGAQHLDLGVLGTTREEAHGPLIAALARGPRTVVELADALAVRPHEVLDIAEPMVVAGTLIELEDGARIALAPR